jgi:hypothetical protein
MFLALFNLLISDVEREEFMNPIRDLGDEHEDIQRLISMGFRIALVGTGYYKLLERIAMPVTYCRKYGRRNMIELVVLTSAVGSEAASQRLLHDCPHLHSNGSCDCAFVTDVEILPLGHVRDVINLWKETFSI